MTTNCPRCGSIEIADHETGYSAGHDHWTWRECLECHLEFDETYDNSQCPGDCPAHAR